MFELIKIALSPGVLPLTLMFIPMMLFWFISMIGAIDFDFFSFTGEGGFDSGDGIEVTGGSLRWMTRFIGSEYAPLPAIMSFLLLFEWGAVMYGHTNWIPDANWKQSIQIAGVAMIPALLLTKLTTLMLRPYFKGLRGLEGESLPVIGRTGHVRSRICDVDSGQIQVEDSESPLLINARLKPNSAPLVRGTPVTVVSHDHDRDIYLVEIKTENT